MISVCIATYNGEQFVEEQLVSTLPQLGENDEIVISDDSSTDKTLEIINSLEDRRIRIFPNQHFHSPIFNFENAIRHAEGDYIFLCDQDDVWLPDKVRKMKDKLQQFDLVVSDCKVVDGSLNVIEESFFVLQKSGSGFCKNFCKNTYLGCCMAFRREILDYILPFPKGIAMHDIWIGLSVEMRGKPYFLNEPLHLYRRHGGNVSFGGEKSKYPLWYKIKYRADMLYYLIKRRYLGI